jgi:hypothetical protein
MLVCAAGCSGAYVEKVVPASGTLTYQGKALEGYKITVFSSGDRQSATAVSQADGKFVLGCNVPGDGAPTGTHRVSVVFVSEVAEGEPGKEVFKTLTPKIKVPKKFEQPETSGLELTIPDGGSSDLKLDLK